ncbi:hypothetical protein [Myroides marinus]|uniref:hypothetical protein n=1 Tax=Myroides marinus TaxID=703342 RepID=UPI002576F7FB|nr:hypothetical protein [Myroides marinus]MDM1376697.1 hypothetical protein [Myroides marinus]
MKSSQSLSKAINNYAFSILPALLVFLIGISIYNTPFYLFPDFFDIKHYSKTYELFNMIISSLTSLIGVYITVSLVAYEFFKQRSGIDFQKSFLINKTNALFISFSVSTIIITFISSLVIDFEKPNYKEVSIIYYNSILFILVLFLLFPVAFNLFSSLNPGKLASEELEKITAKTIYIINKEHANIDEQVERLEDDYLYKVQSIVIALISVSDKIKAKAIIFKSAKKIGKLIIDSKDGNEQKYISKRLVDFYINIIDYTLMQPNNSSLLKNIWLSFEYIYEVLITEKEYAHKLKYFREDFLIRYINRLIANNKEEEIFFGIDVLHNIIHAQMVLNMPIDEELYDLYGLRSQVEKNFTYPSEFSDDAHEKSSHWSEISIEYYNYFSLLMDKAIKYNKPDLLNKCFDTLNELNSKIELKDTLGKYKQCFIYMKSSEMITNYALIAFKEEVFIKCSDAKGLLPRIFEDKINKNKLYTYNVLQRYCWLLIDLVNSSYKCNSCYFV